MRNKKIIYYEDPLHDDFAGTHIETCVVDETYPYAHGPVWRGISHVLYYAVAFPLVWLLHRVVGGVTFQNRKARKAVKGACFLYGNHTAYFDAYTPALLSFPRRAEVLAGPDAVSIKGLRTVVQMLGGLPIPNGLSGMKPFMNTLETAYRSGRDIAIFPEAHIWPYYTGVRPFPATSFAYPIKLHAPVFAYFVAYSEPKGLGRIRRAKATVYVSAPFYPDDTLPHKEAQQKLRDEVYAFMADMAQKHSTYAVIDYRQK